MSGKLDIGGVVALFIGAFILFTLVNALYGTVNDAVVTLNDTMYTAGNETAGSMVVYGWTILQYVVGLGALIIGAKWLTSKAKGL